MSRKLLIALALLLACLAWGCRDAVVPAGAAGGSFQGQKYLFESSYVNFAWGYRATGVVIDSLGHVISYNHSFAVWRPAVPDSVTCAELDEKFAVAETLAVVDRSTLLEQAALIEGAAAGPYSERVQSGADMGSRACSCYRFDRESGRYTPVMLTLTGDFTQTNLAPEAQVLAAWIDSVVAASRR